MKDMCELIITFQVVPLTSHRYGTELLMLPELGAPEDGKSSARAVRTFLLDLHFLDVSNFEIHRAQCTRSLMRCTWTCDMVICETVLLGASASDCDQEAEYLHQAEYQESQAILAAMVHAETVAVATHLFASSA
eukprot:6475479-Amphidinium_carterae.1